MAKLFKVKDIVLEILKTDKEARKDDYILALRVFEHYISPETEIGLAFRCHKELGLPSLHSIVRVRRMLQVEHPELVDEDAKKIRSEEEQEYRNFVKGVS